MRAFMPLLFSASVSRLAATAAPPVLSLVLTVSTLIVIVIVFAKIVLFLESSMIVWRYFFN